MVEEVRKGRGKVRQEPVVWADGYNMNFMFSGIKISVAWQKSIGKLEGWWKKKTCPWGAGKKTTSLLSCLTSIYRYSMK